MPTDKKISALTELLSAALDDELAIKDTSDTSETKRISLTNLLTFCVLKTLYDANSILAANSDDTPAAVTIGEQQVPLRLTGGNIKGGTVAELIALALSAAIPENARWIYTSGELSADGKYSGQTVTGTAGAALAFGDLVYLQTADGRWELASADNAATGYNFLLGFCVLAAAGDGSATEILLEGVIRADTAFPALTIGARAFMSTTAGDIQTTAPDGSTDITRIVGWGVGANTLYARPNGTTLEHV